MGNFKRLSIFLTLILVLTGGISSCTQPARGPTGGAGPANEQETVRTPMGEQTTRESERMPGLTRRPDQREQNAQQRQAGGALQQGQTGGAAGTAQQDDQTGEQGTTVRGYW